MNLHIAVFHVSGISGDYREVIGNGCCSNQTVNCRHSFTFFFGLTLDLPPNSGNFDGNRYYSVIKSLVQVAPWRRSARPAVLPPGSPCLILVEGLRLILSCSVHRALMPFRPKIRGENPRSNVPLKIILNGNFYLYING